MSSDRPLVQPPEPDAAKLGACLRSMRPGATVLVDFDHTFLLENSTELYLDHLRPRWWGALILALIDALGPWRLWGRGAKSSARDPIRVVVATLLAPWTLWTWARAAPKLMARRENAELAASLRSTQASCIVVTFGYRFIVAPMLAGASLGFARLLAAPFGGGAKVRQRGKRWWVQRELGDANVSAAVAVTDAPTDADLLDAVAHPFLLQWPSDRKTRAQAGAYLPLRYTLAAKYPGKRFLWRQLVAEDLALWGLGFGFSLGNAPLALFALPLLALSLFCVYELGYAENDKVAAHEARPTLSEHLARVPKPPWLLAWTVSLASGAAGIALLASANALRGGAPIALAAWVGWLLLTRGVFAGFNRLPVFRRVYAFGGLQVAKSFAPAVLIALNPIGALLLVAQVARQTTNYVIYRYAGDNRSFRRQAHRVIVFVGLLGAFGLAQPDVLWAAFATPQLWAALAYCGARVVFEHRRFRRFAVDARHRDYLEGRTAQRPGEHPGPATRAYQAA